MKTLLRDTTIAPLAEAFDFIELACLPEALDFSEAETISELSREVDISIRHLPWDSDHLRERLYCVLWPWVRQSI
jgi:hypothetical protein